MPICLGEVGWWLFFFPLAAFVVHPCIPHVQNNRTEIWTWLCVKAVVDFITLLQSFTSLDAGPETYTSMSGKMSSQHAHCVTWVPITPSSTLLAHMQCTSVFCLAQSEGSQVIRKCLKFFLMHLLQCTTGMSPKLLPAVLQQPPN